MDDKELFDHDIELSVVGSVLINPDVLIETMSLLDSSMFHDYRNRSAWEAIINLHSQKKAIDVLTVTAEMEACGHGEVRQAYLMDAINNTPTALHAVDYAHKIRELAIRRKMVNAASMIAQYGMKTDKSLDELLVKVRKEVDGIESYGLRGDLEIPDASDVGLEFMGTLDDIGKCVLKTYIPKVDMAIGGFDVGTITVLASAASMGKSTLAFQVSRNLASRGIDVIYFSNEMTRLQLWIKAACGASKLSWRDIKRDGVTPDQKDVLVEHSSKLIDSYKSHLRIDDRTDHTTQTIWQACRKYKPKFAVVDVLQNMNDKGDREVDRLGDIIKQLRYVAQDCECHILALTHVNRSVEMNKGKMPTMAELRDSGKLENTADNVLLITSDDYYRVTEETADWWVVKLIVAKCRDGVRNVAVNLSYNLKEQWFYDTNPPIEKIILHRDDSDEQ